MSDARERAPRAGFTLVELLIVVTLVAMLLGLGLGVFSHLDLSDRVSVSSVQGVVRSAHNWSVARSATARVVIDRERGVLGAEGLQVVGTWQFEATPIVGAFGVEGVSSGGRVVDDGFLGHALSFAGEPNGSRVSFAVQQDPAYDLSRGFQIRCAVRRAGARGGTLLDLGGVVTVETTSDGALRASFTAQRVDDDPAAGAGGLVTATTRPGVLPADRWVPVEVSYDRRWLRVLVDGQAAAMLEEVAPVARVSGPLVLSPSSEAFPGAVDALTISVVVGDDRVELPQGVTLSKGTPSEIVFRAGGALDPDVHREPVRIVLEYEDGRKDTVVINLFGTVE